MPDITMCPSLDCPKRNVCYRNEASGTKPNEYRQSFFVEQPRKGLLCDYYWNRNPHGDNDETPEAQPTTQQCDPQPWGIPEILRLK